MRYLSSIDAVTFMYGAAKYFRTCSHLKLIFPRFPACLAPGDRDTMSKAGQVHVQRGPVKAKECGNGVW